jgi:hypothetical protein
VIIWGYDDHSDREGGTWIDVDEGRQGLSIEAYNGDEREDDNPSARKPHRRRIQRTGASNSAGMSRSATSSAPTGSRTKGRSTVGCGNDRR